MIKILVVTPCCTPVSIDHYEMMRGEARILHNIGFGLAWTGYDVNIANSFSNNILIEGLDGGKVCLSKGPIRTGKGSYDFELSWSHFINLCEDENCKKLCMVLYQYEFGLEDNIEYFNRGLKGEFITPFKGLTDYLNEGRKELIKYLPPIYPIPIYRLGFKDYSEFDINKLDSNKLDSNKSTINIFVYVCSWEQHLPGVLEIGVITKRLKERFNKVGKKIKLYISIDSKNTIKNVTNISQYGDEVEYVYKCKYDKYISTIEKMDLFVIKGNSSHTTAGMFDILSLGKPILYVAWERPISEGEKRVIRNPLHTKTKNMIYTADDIRLIISKVDKFLDNTKEHYNEFRSCIEDSNFKNWKEIAKGIFG